MVSTMNPHARSCIASALLGVVAILCARAQVVDFQKERQPVVEIHDLWRFQPGDDPDGKLGWANPNFDDSAWPHSKNGRWPLPLPAPDSVEWTRARVTVPADASGSLAINVSDPYHALMSFEIFVNGRPAVQRGCSRPSSSVLAVE